LILFDLGLIKNNSDRKRLYFIILLIIGAILSGILVGKSQKFLLLAIFGLLIITVVLLYFKYENIIYFWLFFASCIQWWQGIELGSGIPNITFDRIFILLAILYLIIHPSITHLLGRLSKTSLFIFGFYCFYSLSLVLTRMTDPLNELFYWFSTVVMPFLVLYIGLSFRMGKYFWVKIAKGTQLLVLILFAAALYEKITLHPFIPHGNITMIGYTDVRIASLTGSAVTLSYLLGIIFPLTILPIYYERTFFKRVFDVFIILLALLLTFWNGYRATWISILIVMCLACVILPKFRKYFILLLVLSVFIFTIIGGEITSDSFIDRIENLDNLHFRFEAIQVQLNRAAKNLLFGQGGIKSWIVEGDFTGATNYSLLASHNSYTTFLLYYGIVGFLLFFSIWAIALSSISIALKYNLKPINYPQRFFMIILGLMIISNLIINAGIDTRFFTTVNLIFTFFIGVSIQIADKIITQNKKYGKN